MSGYLCRSSSKGNCVNFDADWIQIGFPGHSTLTSWKTVTRKKYSWIESLGIEFIVKCKIPPGLMIRNLKYFPRLAWIKWDRSSDRGHQRSVSRISHGASLQHFQTQPHSIIVIFPQKDFAWKLLHKSTYFPQWLLHISSKLNHLDQTRMRMMLSTLWWDYPRHFLTATAQGRKFCIMIFGDFALTVSR